MMTIRSVILFLGLFSFCYAQQNNTQKIIVKEGFGIDGVVVIGETKKNIRERHGRPDPFLYTQYKKMAVTHPYNKGSAKSVTIKKVGRPRDTFYYINLELFMGFRDDSVSNVYFKSDKYQTSKGLAIGDSREKAYQLYREGDSCQPILQVPVEGIDISFDRCNRVEEIRIYKPHAGW